MLPINLCTLSLQIGSGLYELKAVEFIPLKAEEISVYQYCRQSAYNLNNIEEQLNAEKPSKLAK
jgi:hypothetical protein